MVGEVEESCVYIMMVIGSGPRGTVLHCGPSPVPYRIHPSSLLGVHQPARLSSNRLLDNLGVMHAQHSPCPTGIQQG